MNLYVIQIPRLDVENDDIGMITHYIKQFEKIKAPSQCAEITFSGYDETTDEVFEIEAIRKWVTKLLRQVPEILYYTSIHMGTTTRLLACVYDIETVSPKRMNAYQANEYTMKHGVQQQQPIVITIPEDERMRLYGAIKSYGLKRKDLHGAGAIVNALKEVFDRD